MIKTATFGIREFVDTINRYGNNDNNIGLFKMIGKAENELLFNRLLPARLDAVSIFLVERGETIIEIDFKKYHLQSNNLLDIGILHVIQSIELFDNSIVYHLIIGKEFIDLALREKKPLPLSYILSRRADPLFTFGIDSCRVLCSCMENFASHLANRDHVYRSELLQNDIQVLLMEIGNIAHHQEKVKLHVPKVIDRKNLLTANFIQLLTKFSQTQHEVNFYA